MQASSGSQSDPDDVAAFGGWLQRSLYRFDCPDAHTLGEYQLDVLEPEQRTRVAAHAVECDECRTELQTLRSFLAMPTTVPESTFEKVRRVVATLFSPPLTGEVLAYGGLRGTAESDTRVFSVDDVTITIGPGQSSGSVLGLVMVGDVPAETLAGREVRLVPTSGAPTRGTLDDLGNFEIEGLSPGAYVLEVDLPGSLVIVEELRVY
jgi:hypothetical protein